MKFHIGDRIKLTDQAAATAMRCLKRHRVVNWSARRGVVACEQRGGHAVMVVWDDRRTRDQWPEKAIELVR